MVAAEHGEVATGAASMSGVATIPELAVVIAGS
jgi:hypothetical protein